MEIIALVIFGLTYIGIIFTRIPGLNIDRPSAAFSGAVAIVLFGVLSFEEAIKSIDFNTIILLLGMMILVVALELDGFFTLIAQKTTRLSKSRSQLLFTIIFITGISSAFLVNDAVVLMFTPVIIRICLSSKLNPLPYLIAEIMASNAGSTLTITGNPQNILIGIASGISYGKFLLLMLPVSIISMYLIYIVIKFLYKKDFTDRTKIEYEENYSAYHYSSMKYSVPIFLLVIVLFFLSKIINLSYPMIAIVGGALVLLFGKIKPSKIIKEVDWVLLLFFASLFIVVTGIEHTGWINNIIEMSPINENFQGIVLLHSISLVLSQIVSNVPLVILLLPIIKPLGSELLWLSLASSATLAGNLTIIGAMANLIVIEIARTSNIEIKFMQFFKAGIIITTATLLLSTIYLYTISYLNLL
jgi:Na+/H+ antiporter NhaD/arsenite permease-like protein